MFDHIHKKHLWLAAALLVLLIIVLSIKYIMDAMLFQPHGTLFITSVPDKISVEIQGHTRHINTSSQRSIPLPVGSYDITFRAEGFAAHTVPMTIQDKEEKDIAFILQPETDAARREIEKSKYEEPKGAAEAYKMQQQIEQLAKAAPIVEKLPLNAKWYTITQCPPSRVGLGLRTGICIRGLESHMAEAYRALVALGYDLGPYDISVNDVLLPNKNDVANGWAEPCKESVNGYCRTTGE